MEPADQVLSFNSARVAASIMSSGEISKSGSRVGVGRLNAPAAGRARRRCAKADGRRSPPPPKPRRRPAQAPHSAAPLLGRKTAQRAHPVGHNRAWLFACDHARAHSTTPYSSRPACASESECPKGHVGNGLELVSLTTAVLSFVAPFPGLYGSQPWQPGSLPFTVTGNQSSTSCCLRNTSRSMSDLWLGYLRGCLCAGRARRCVK